MLHPVVAGGLAYAGAIALMACGITIIYMCTRTFNFAHATMCTWGFYVTYTMVELYGGTPYQYFPLAFLVGALLGAVCYFGINRRLLRRKASEITLMMSTLGYHMMLLALIQIYCDYLTYKLGLYPRRVTMSVHDVEVAGVRASTIVSICLAVGILTVLHLFMTRTKFGIAMRATVENPMLASVIGINSEKVYLTSWILGGGLAALGGALVSFVITATPVLGDMIIVVMFAGSILGGLYSVYGSLLGGFVVGLAEYLGTYGLSLVLGGWVMGYRLVIPLLIMALTLLLFPRGLAGIPWRELPTRLREALRPARVKESLGRLGLGLRRGRT